MEGFNLKNCLNKLLKILFIVLTLFIVFSCSMKIFAATIYTNNISKGDTLQFKGNSWNVYNSITYAQNCNPSYIIKHLYNRC